MPKLEKVKYFSQIFDEKKENIMTEGIPDASTIKNQKSEYRVKSEKSLIDLEMIREQIQLGIQIPNTKQEIIGQNLHRFDFMKRTTSNVNKAHINTGNPYITCRKK